MLILFLIAGISKAFMQRPKVRNAILISGGLHRFIFRDSRIGGFKPHTDVFIQLFNDSSTRELKRKIVSIIPYKVSADTIREYFLDLGAATVHIEIYNKESLRRFRHRMGNAVGPEKIHKLSLVPQEPGWTLLTKRWLPHSVMFLLRHLVYTAALRYSTYYGFNYTHFLYQREDNVYVTPKPMKLPALTNLIRLCDDVTVPCLVLDKYCGWGSWPDKIYYFNELGGNLLFSRTWDDFVRFLYAWVTVDQTKYKWNPLDQMQTEFITEYWVQRVHGLKPFQVDFERTEQRYDGHLCIFESYINCFNYSFRFKWRKCPVLNRTI